MSLTTQMDFLLKIAFALKYSFRTFSLKSLYLQLAFWPQLALS